MTSTALVTGGSGFVGLPLTAELLSAGARVVLLLRASSAHELEQRVAVLRQRLGRATGLAPATLADRVRAIRGDVCLPGLGVGDFALERLAREVDAVYHCAADTTFDLPLDEARRINVSGTREVLAFARLAMRRGGLEVFAHVSTAYVAGRRRGRCYEDDLSFAAGFLNTYEQSKAEAETLVRQAAGDLPAVVFRPSIVVGHSTTGEATDFKVFYRPLRWIFEGRLAALPSTKRARLDIIPVDFVARAIARIGHGAEAGRTFHLTVGADRTIALRHFTELAMRHLRCAAAEVGVPAPAGVPRFLSPAIVRPWMALVSRLGPPSWRNAAHKLAPLLPYLDDTRVFDTTQADAALIRNGLTPPPTVDTYAAPLFRFCIATDWGRRPPRQEPRPPSTAPTDRGESHEHGASLDHPSAHL